MKNWKYSDESVSDLFAAFSLTQLLDLWELTEYEDGEEISTVRGWLMDLLEERNPKGFNAWLDQDAPEDRELRQYMTAKK